MRRRKWWIIGITAGLLAACVGVWKWSERPPYAFMEGAQLWFVAKVRWNSDVYKVSYSSTRPASELVAAARAETRQPWKRLPTINIWTMGIEGSASGSAISSIDSPDDLSAVNESLKEQLPPLPAGTKATVDIWRKPTTMDRIRAWMFGWRWKG